MHPRPIHNRETAVIVTALGIETKAVLRHLAGVSSETVSGTGFCIGQFECWNVAVAEAGPGNTSAAAVTVRACEHYQPKIAIFVGVAGGVKDVAIGDVVVATKVYGYESGKDKDTGFQARPALFNSAHELEQRARTLSQAEDWQTRLDPQLGHTKPKVFVGPIAAGEKVVASTEASTAKLIREHYSDVLAVEMEGYGFLEGVHISHPVQGCVIRGISDLLSGKTSADRSGSQERAADAAAGVAFQILAGIETGTAKGPSLDISKLKELAAALLDAGMPPSIAMLFADAPATARAALESAVAAERTIVEANRSKNGPLRIPIIALVSSEERRHLILGPPGSGKTHALWHTANQLLHDGSVIPLFLATGQGNRWDDVTSAIREIAPTLSLDEILRDPRICVMLDAWSEFGSGENIGEKQKALRALRNVRVIANGKASDVTDAPFKTWSLELLAPQQVREILDAARLGGVALPGAVLDLLRLPLLLSIHVLSDATGSATGDLLRKFHDHLARDLPEAFTVALAEAVAAAALAGDRAYGRLVSDLQGRATAKGITESGRMLQRLGTIVERNGQALPIHDLYWSWLCGRGLLALGSTTAAIGRLETRESYRLALQSGARPWDTDIATAANDDLVLAAALDASLHAPSPNPDLAAGISLRLNDGRLAVRSRGGLAALESMRPGYLKGALETLSAITSAKLYVPDWAHALQSQQIFPQRATIADWLGSGGTDLVLDAIAERGGPEWVPWLEQMASAGRISRIAALGVALACGTEIPAWGKPHLDNLFREKPWMLRAAAERRSNVELGRRIAGEYERLVTTVIRQNSSAWLDLNRALVGCADDAAFALLLDRFGAMTKSAQEHLGYAVVERGQPWIAAFQRIAFATPTGQQHHRLAEIVSPEIDDPTARAWIASGHYEEGWRVLIARHGEAVLPELVAELPTSFAGLDHIPSLAVMRFLDQGPASLTDELWKRLGSPMKPKAAQDALEAIAKAYPTGVPSIVQFISQQPDVLPTYHLAQVLRLYAAWRERTGAEVDVRSATDEPESFPRWIARYSALARWDNHFTPQMLARLPDLAIEIVLNHIKSDLEKSTAVLEALKDLKSYDADLLDYMLSVPKLAKLIPGVFADAFDTFPVEQLDRCITSSDIDQEALLFRLASTSNPLHRPVHAKLISRVLDAPMNLHHARYVASMLRGHTSEDTILLLSNAHGMGGDNWLWLVREVEAARRERLINEDGEFRRH
jgi:nucleoside phosphorylase